MLPIHGLINFVIVDLSLFFSQAALTTLLLLKENDHGCTVITLIINVINDKLLMHNENAFS